MLLGQPWVTHLLWEPHNGVGEHLGGLQISAMTSSALFQRVVPLLFHVSKCFSRSSSRSGNSESRVGASTSPGSIKSFPEGSSPLTFPPARHEDTGCHTAWPK